MFCRIFFFISLLVASIAWSKTSVEKSIETYLEIAEEHKCELPHYKFVKEALFPGLERESLMVKRLVVPNEAYAGLVTSMNELTKLAGIITTIKSVKNLLSICRNNIYFELNHFEKRGLNKIEENKLLPTIDVTERVTGNLKNFFQRKHQELKAHHQKVLAESASELSFFNKAIVTITVFMNTEIELNYRLELYKRELLERMPKDPSIRLMHWLLLGSDTSEEEFASQMYACLSGFSREFRQSFIDNLNFLMILREFRAILNHKVTTMEKFFGLRSGRKVITQAERDLHGHLKRILHINFKNFREQSYDFIGSIPDNVSSSCEEIKLELSSSMLNPYKHKKWDRVLEILR